MSPIFSRETRLGLVLYGGVSLAIYMNGVCQEFYNAVRGRGIYKLIKALTDSDIVIDIVSGTSAGGVNGVLLSYAIANSNHNLFVDFKDLAKLWIDHADIKKLLPKIKLNKDSKTLNSIFDGEFYQQKLEEAFTDQFKQPPEDEFYSDFSELDLFVTATDLHGRIHKVSDNTGRIIEVKDHRTVFQLKYRQEQADFIDNPFKPGKDTQKALAKLCRITSCFPVAFPTVEVNMKLPSTEDKKLIEWGKLWDREDNNNTLFFVDGGVLSNRPFTTTIKTIYGRTAYRPVERKLFYVDPAPEKFLDRNNSSTIPPWLVAIKSKINIPNYQSITKDLELIKEGNRKVIRRRLLKNSLQMRWDDIIESYPDIDINNSEFDITKCIERPEFITYLKCRFLSLLDNSIEQILKKSFGQEDINKSFIENLSDLLNAKNILLNEDFIEIYLQIRHWDLEFFIRKHDFLLEVTAQKIKEIKEDNIKDYLVLRYLAYQLSWQLELLRIIQRSVYEILKGYKPEEIDGINDKGDKKIKNIYKFIKNIYKNLLKTDSNQIHIFDNYYASIKIIDFPDQINFDQVSWSDLNLFIPERESSERKKEIFAKIYELPICQVLLKKTNDEKNEYIKEIKLRIKQNSANSTQSILKIIDDHSKELINKASEDFEKCRLKDFSEQYELIDMMLYPYEYLSDIVTKKPIQVVRISPNDDEDKQKGLGYGKGKDIEQKLRGYKYHAFGGFFDKAWRTNDILWGRLDGLSRIVEALVTPTSINNFKEFIKKYPEWEKLIPEGKAEEREKIIKHLKSFIKEPNHFSDEKTENFKDFLDTIVTLGQSQSLAEDLAEKIKSKNKGNLEKALENLGKQTSINPLSWLSWGRIIWHCLRMIKFLIPSAIMGGILGTFLGVNSNILVNDRLTDATAGLIIGIFLGVIIGLIVSTTAWLSKETV